VIPVLRPCFLNTGPWWLAGKHVYPRVGARPQRHGNPPVVVDLVFIGCGQVCRADREDEVDAVVDTVIAAVYGWVPVVVGVSELTTAKTTPRLLCTQHAAADAVMVLPVSY
jgi:hypothetical protein